MKTVGWRVLCLGGESSGKALSAGTGSNLSLCRQRFGGCSPHSFTSTSWECSSCRCPGRLMRCWWEVGQEVGRSMLPSACTTSLPRLSHPSSQLLGLDPGLPEDDLRWCLGGTYQGWLLSSPMQASPIPGAEIPALRSGQGPGVM